MGKDGLAPSESLHRVSSIDQNASRKDDASSRNQENPRHRRPPVEDRIELSEDALREALSSPRQLPEDTDPAQEVPDLPPVSFRAQV